MKRKPLFVALGCLLSCSSPAAASPAIGQKAPPIETAEWITRKPSALPGEKGAEKHAFLVEFWATWCPPCLKSIPHLGALQKKHEKAGLLVIGISNEDPETIRAFIKSKMKMAYHVAADDDMRTSTAYTDDIQTIPHAFLVDKSGLVVWSGNPLADRSAMDRIIEEVLAGKFDLEAARNAASAEAKYKSLLTELQKALAVGDPAKLFEIVDRMIAVKPRELQARLIKRNFMKEFGRASEIPAFNAALEKTFEDSPSSLQQLVQLEHDKNLADRNAGLMLRCALRLNELSERRDANSLAVLARIQCELGMVDEAILTQQQAVGLAPDEAMAQFEKVLAYYEEAKKLALSQRAQSSANEIEQ